MSKASPNLQVVASLLVNVRFRDQSLKLAQYALKLMHPFYIQRATDIEDDPILHAQHIISDSRKIFRLFKSLNHVSKLINSSLVDTHCLKDVVVKILCMIEDALWSLFYVFDHQLFFFRRKLIDLNETTLTQRFALTWFCATLTAFIRSFYQLHHCHQEQRRLLDEQERLGHSELFSKGPHLLRTAQIQQRLNDLQREKSTLVFYSAKASLDILVSGSYAPYSIWKKSLGSCLDQAAVGLCGLLSSVMSIYDVWPEQMSTAASEGVAVHRKLQRCYSGTDVAEDPTHTAESTDDDGNNAD